MLRRGCFRAACFGLLALSAIAACSGRTTDLTAVGNDSESHFLVCKQSADCGELGPTFRCDGGSCRSGDAELLASFSRACTTDSQCAAGLTCLDNACSQRCEVAADCGIPGAGCYTYEYADDGASRNQCLQTCTEDRDCMFPGGGGRCYGVVCRETLADQCGDVGQPGAEWSCYEDIAVDLFRERQGTLLTTELCLPTVDNQVGTYEYRRCADSACAGGQGGCSISGLVLASEPVVTESRSDLETLFAARGEVQLREPLRVQFDLLDPLERCEYSVNARFWNIHLLDGFRYLSAAGASSAALADPTEPWAAGTISTQAVEGGFWQVAHQVDLAHEDSSSVGAIIEDSEAEVQLLSGGERCRTIQGHVGVSIRDSLVTTINGALERWGDGLGDTVECTPCGEPGCLLACRYLSP